jgi:hypothetical protein
VNHNYTDLSLRLRFIRTYDPYQELPYYSFEECLTAALLVRVNQTRPRQKRGKSSSPKGERGKPSSPAPKGGEATTCMLNGEKQQELGRKGNHSISVDLAMNFSPSQHFGTPTSMKAALP